MRTLWSWLLGHLAVGLMWSLHFLPLPVLSRMGEGLGWLGWHLVRPRRRVALINLAKCFPHWSGAERRRVARQHFQLFGRFILEHGIQWWAPRARLDKLVHLEGLEHLDALRGNPVIVLAPHFLGLEMGGIRLSSDRPIATMYQSQRNQVLDRAIWAGRERYRSLFATSRVFWYRDGMRAVARTVKQGVPFYVLPDMDLGARDSVFAPFFGIPTATVTSVAWLARLTGAWVVPCVTRMLPGGQGYRARFFPPWDNYPTGDPVADARRMNAFIEQQVMEQPEQYYWLHKRFKTRPPGEASFY